MTAAISSIEMYAFSYYYDRAVEMGLIGRDRKVYLIEIDHLHYIINYIQVDYLSLSKPPLSEQKRRPQYATLGKYNI